WRVASEDHVLGYDLSHQMLLTSSSDPSAAVIPRTIEGRKLVITFHDLADGHKVGETTLPADKMAGGESGQGGTLAPGGAWLALWNARTGSAEPYLLMLVLCAGV